MDTGFDYIQQCDAGDIGLSPDLISPKVLDIVQTLQGAGHDAYIVGGSVRDLLLKYKPKDYDVATSAHPEQIVQCFRKSRVIGRRFKIVHVGFGRDKIEVSTFRAKPDSDLSNSGVEIKDGLIIRDNQYGSLEEDILRRDFTINSMYYDPYNDRLICHKAALDDLRDRCLRFIGVAEERCREDPVRILRALRFVARNDLKMTDKIKENIRLHANLLQNISPARLFEENLKWMHGGYAMRNWDLFREYGLVETLFPTINDYLAHDTDGCFHKLLKILFFNTDKRVAQGKPVTPIFTFLTMLWPVILQKKQAFIDRGDSPNYALRQAYSEIISFQQQYITIPYRLVNTGSEICMLQQYLTSNRRKNLYSAFKHPKFRAAYDLLCFCAEAGLNDPKYAQWWTRIQEVDAEEQTKMIDIRAKTRSSPRRKPKK